jgi:hypothetical protein
MALDELFAVRHTTSDKRISKTEAGKTNKRCLGAPVTGPDSIRPDWCALSETGVSPQAPRYALTSSHTDCPPEGGDMTGADVSAPVGPDSIRPDWCALSETGVSPPRYALTSSPSALEAAPHRHPGDRSVQVASRSPVCQRREAAGSARGLRSCFRTRPS